MEVGDAWRSASAGLSPPPARRPVRLRRAPESGEALHLDVEFPGRDLAPNLLPVLVGVLVGLRSGLVGLRTGSLVGYRDGGSCSPSS